VIDQNVNEVRRLLGREKNRAEGQWRPSKEKWSNQKRLFLQVNQIVTRMALRSPAGKYNQFYFNVMITYFTIYV